MRNRFQHLATWGLGITGILLLIFSVAYEMGKSHETNQISSFTNTPAQEKQVKLIKVDIEGAVQQPGVYEIPNDSRIQDVLISAGGLTAKANRTILSKDINLAQTVYDGQKIFIPETGEDLPQTSITLPSRANSSIININLASEAELDTLSGIGPVTAKKIIASRPYQNISELLTRHLVSASVYDKIKNSITVN